MATFTDTNRTSDRDNAIMEIEDGNGNGYRVGVDSNNRLKVTPGYSPNQIQSLSTKFQYNDMNSSNGGVDRGTSIGSTNQDIYSYSGSGYFIGYVLCLEDKQKWHIELLIDDVSIFGTGGFDTNDLMSKTIYGWEPNRSNPSLGLDVNEETIKFEAPIGLPLRFDYSIVLRVRRRSGESSKKFNAGLVAIVKE